MTKKSVKEMFVEFYKDAIKRKNFNGNIYLDIFKRAGDQYIDYKKQSEDLLVERKKNKMTKLELLNKTTRIYDEMQRHELIAITFAAMFLECLIWDYAAVNTSKNMTEDYLGKISLLGKWHVIPKLVNNDKSITIDHKAITLLKKLVQLQ